MTLAVPSATLVTSVTRVTAGQPPWLPTLPTPCVPPGRPVTLTTLVRAACLRWPVEETFECGKDHFGLDHCQVRLYTAVLRHIVLTIAALAVCAVTAAEKSRGPQPVLPDHSDQQRPQDIGLITRNRRRGQTTVQPAHPHRPRHRPSPALGRLETTPPSTSPLVSPPHPPPAGSDQPI